MNDEEDPKEFQKWMARIQVWSSACVTLGGVFLGSGISMLITSLSGIGTASTLEKEAPFLFQLVNMFGRLGLTFSFIGTGLILFGLSFPMYLLRRKSQNTKPILTLVIVETNFHVQFMS